MATVPRLLPVEDDGRVLLPADLREKLGLKHGDLLSVIETPDGLLLASRRAAIDREIEQVDAELRQHGVTLDELIESGREIRERYGTVAPSGAITPQGFYATVTQRPDVAELMRRLAR